VKATENWYGPQRVCKERYLTAVLIITCECDRIDRPTSVLTLRQELSSTGWTNFVIDPERHRAFPGTTSA